MSICRGDIRSAYTAYSYILSFSPVSNAYDILYSVIRKASAFHFSALPGEVLRINPDTAWNVIAGMCNSCLDKRALSLFIMIYSNSNNQKAKAFKKWLEHNSPDYTTFETFENKIIHSAITYLSMNEGNVAEDFFSYNAPISGELYCINKIEPMYFLGYNSWIYNYIDNSLRIIYNSSNISNIIYLFEINRIVRKMEHINYWDDAKFSIFGAQADYFEELWNERLLPYAVSITNTIAEMRFPVGI